MTDATWTRTGPRQWDVRFETDQERAARERYAAYELEMIRGAVNARQSELNAWARAGLHIGAEVSMRRITGSTLWPW